MSRPPATPAASTSDASAATSQGRRVAVLSSRGGGGTGRAGTGTEADSGAGTAPASHCARHADTSAGRFSGHSASADVTAAPNPALTPPADTCDTGASGSACLRAAASTRAGASTGFRPLNARYATAPSAYTSVHGPCFPCFPAVWWYCSCGAYPGVSTDVSERECTPAAYRAAPKSIRTGAPSPRSITFAGLMSRCIRPAPCTSSTPGSSSSSNARTRASGHEPSACNASSRFRPSTYSITMYAVPHASITRYTRTMRGWSRRASVRASSRKRVRPHR